MIIVQEYQSQIMPIKLHGLMKMTNEPYSFLKIFRWFIEKYLQLEKSVLPFPCKLVNISGTYPKKLAQVQFTGHTHVIEIEVKQIINENLFEYFSAEDKKKLFAAVYERDRLKLAERHFCNYEKKEMAVLADIETGEKIEIPIDTLSANPELIELMHPVEANRIGFIAGLQKFASAFSKKPKGSSNG